MDSKYKDLFDSLSGGQLKELGVNDRILVVDSLNTFIRSFTVIKHVNRYAVPIGGLTGFLKSIAFAVKLVRPTRVFLVFDGEGSTTNKKYLYPEYKANRKIKRITTWDAYSNQEEETDSMTTQLLRLIDYLKCLPVDLISLPKIEADDVIGYISKQFNTEVTIMSSDQDYLQLVNDKITVYSPIKRIFYTPKVVKEEYGIPPENFLTRKILLGDDGDNVPGVLGLGPKKLVKLFPEITTDSLISLEEVIDKSKVGINPLYKKILNFEHQLHINKKLMDLHNPNISEEQLIQIHEAIDNPIKTLDVKGFNALYEEDTLDNAIPNLTSWIYTHFNELSKYK